MHLIKKINIKRYLIPTIIQIIIGYLLSKSIEEFFIIILAFAAAILNQWILVSAVDKMIKGASNRETNGSPKILRSFFVKTIILVIAMGFGVHIMGKRIIIPVLMYVVQIFILYYSLNENKKD